MDHIGALENKDTKIYLRIILQPQAKHSTLHIKYIQIHLKLSTIELASFYKKFLSDIVYDVILSISYRIQFNYEVRAIFEPLHFITIFCRNGFLAVVVEFCHQLLIISASHVALKVQVDVSGSDRDAEKPIASKSER